MTKLRAKLINWAIENNDRDFYDYLVEFRGSYKSLLRRSLI